MKHFRAWAGRHHNVETPEAYYDYTEKDGTEAEILAKAVLDTVEDDACFSITDEQKEEIKQLVLSGKAFDKAFDNSLCLWRDKNSMKSIGVGFGESSNQTDKYENRWVELKFIKEQLETINYVAIDSEIEALDDISIPDTIEMGVFRYADGRVDIERL